MLEEVLVGLPHFGRYPKFQLHQRSGDAGARKPGVTAYVCFAEFTKNIPVSLSVEGCPGLITQERKLLLLCALYANYFGRRLPEKRSFEW
jgi:hypothetical protein